MWWSLKGHKRQYGKARARSMLDKQGYTRTRAHAYGHATYARAHTHTHTQKYVILIAFSQQQWLCQRSSLLRYTYVDCLV